MYYHVEFGHSSLPANTRNQNKSEVARAQNSMFARQRPLAGMDKLFS